jgi:hypothetical protein
MTPMAADEEETGQEERESSTEDTEGHRENRGGDPQTSLSMSLCVLCGRFPFSLFIGVIGG